MYCLPLGGPSIKTLKKTKYIFDDVVRQRETMQVVSIVKTTISAAVTLSDSDGNLIHR